MAYVLRDAQGKIVAASAIANLGDGWVFIESQEKEYLDFLEQSLTEGDQFRQSDIQLARVLEDLIALLVERNTIRFTDLPPAAQKRLNDRQSMRQKGQLSGLLDESVGIL